MQNASDAALIAHRPLEEEQVVLVVWEVAAEGEVSRADKWIVDGDRAVEQRVGAWRVWWVCLVTKGEGICNVRQYSGSSSA